MANSDIFQLIYADLEERSYNNVFENLKQDNAYQAAAKRASRLNEQYENLKLSKKQHKIIEKRIESIQAKNSAYDAVIFRMGMQYCFSLLMQLADLK